MSDGIFTIVIAAASLSVFLAWVPFLTLICPPWRRFLLRRSLQKKLTNQQS